MTFVNKYAKWKSVSVATDIRVAWETTEQMDWITQIKRPTNWATPGDCLPIIYETYQKATQSYPMISDKKFVILAAIRYNEPKEKGW